MTPRHVLTLADLSAAELNQLIQRAIELKRLQHAGRAHTPLVGKTMAMIFEKSSTRTRVSFEAGMAQLGGAALFLSPRDTQLDRGEPVEDSARVISRMVDVVVIRANRQSMIERFAEHSRAPVINALSDQHHPCQLLADIQTYVERHGDIAGRTVAWIGDGNNVCHSWIQAAALFRFTLRLACPAGYQPDETVVKNAGKYVEKVSRPADAASNADIVVTDTWASMGQEEEKAKRIKDFAGYQVDAALMRTAKAHAIFMHCLPAYRGYEVAAEVIDGPQSAVWDEAENRLHAQKALLELLLVPAAAA